MALNNVPLSGQTLNTTRIPINSNFTTINAAFLVDHVEYATPGQGKHNKVTFPVQAAAPAFSSTDDGFYSLLYATTAKNELFLHGQKATATTNVPFTASVLSVVTSPIKFSAGFTYLPSGILLKWGQQNGNGVTNVQVNGIANSPNFAGLITVQLTVEASAITDSNSFVRVIDNWNIPVQNFFQVFCSPRASIGAGNCGFTWLAIGY